MHNNKSRILYMYRTSCPTLHITEQAVKRPFRSTIFCHSAKPNLHFSVISPSYPHRPFLSTNIIPLLLLHELLAALSRARMYTAADMRYVWDVAEMSNGDVVIAAGPGLYHSSNGKCNALRTSVLAKIALNMMEIWRMLYRCRNRPKTKQNSVKFTFTQEKQLALPQAGSQASSFIRIKFMQQTVAMIRHKCFKTMAHRRKDGVSWDHLTMTSQRKAIF